MMSKISEEHEIDITNASNSLWLVKVPKYIALQWQQHEHGDTIGSLFIARRPNQKVQMSLSLSTATSTATTATTAAATAPTTTSTESKKSIPKEYKLTVEPIKEQLMTAFSEQIIPAQSSVPQCSTLKLTGYLSQKVSVSPISEASYMDLKKDSIRNAFLPKRTSMQLDNIVKNFKPITDHVENIENRKNKKNKVRKYKTQEEVFSVLFEAFNKQRYYNIRDLMMLTAEPLTSLKTVLKEICDYNVRNPNKNMWELKAEYRHYTEKDKDKETET